jgi:hypothetical protein
MTRTRPYTAQPLNSSVVTAITAMKMKMPITTSIDVSPDFHARSDP